jgi:hypothetical protein
MISPHYHVRKFLAAPYQTDVAAGCAQFISHQGSDERLAAYTES